VAEKTKSTGTNEKLDSGSGQLGDEQTAHS
jgi:hypothetical protein